MWSKVRGSDELGSNVCIIVDLPLRNCMSWVVRYLIIMCFSLLFSNYWTCVFNIFCVCCIFVFYFVYSVFLVFFIVSPYIPFPIFGQVYRPLPPSGNPVAANKYHVMLFPIVWWLVCGHEFSLSLDGAKFGYLLIRMRGPIRKDYLLALTMKIIWLITSRLTPRPNKK